MPVMNQMEYGIALIYKEFMKTRFGQIGWHSGCK
jgi:hypothetical protein